MLARSRTRATRAVFCSLKTGRGGRARGMDSRAIQNGVSLFPTPMDRPNVEGCDLKGLGGGARTEAVEKGVSRYMELDSDYFPHLGQANE